jgi:group I intron endonuclease
MSDKAYGVIYKLTSPSGKVYIGQTRNLRNRMYSYACQSKNGRSPIHLAIKSYGMENMVKEVVCECPNQEMLDLCEQVLIEKYNSTDRNFGYNVLEGGRGVTDEQLAKIKAGRKPLSEEGKRKIGAATKERWAKYKEILAITYQGNTEDVRDPAVKAWLKQEGGWTGEGYNFDYPKFVVDYHNALCHTLGYTDMCL